MATEYLFSNNATTTLAQSVSATATVLNVASGDGSLFPSPASGQAFAVTLVDAATGLTNEICYCTSRSGDQLTVIRGREGTNAIAWAAGDTCANYITADVMESWLQESDLNGYLTQSDAASTYVKKTGDTSTGTQYSTQFFSGGFGGGWNGARTNTGDYGWTNGLAFGNPANDGKYRGTWTVTDVLNEGGSNSSGLNLTGYDAAGKTYQWYFAWNGKVITPGGVLAFESDLSGYVANTNPGISGALTGTSLCVNPSDGRVNFAYSGNTKIGTIAWYADVVSEATARANADNNLQAQISAKMDGSFAASGLFDGSQGSTTSGTIVGGTWMRVGNTLTQNLVIENIGGGTVTVPFAFSGNNNQVTVIVQDGTGSNNTYTTGNIQLASVGIHASGGGGTGRLHLTVSGPYGT